MSIFGAQILQQPTVFSKEFLSFFILTDKFFIFLVR
jgi:hypothetical protein